MGFLKGAALFAIGVFIGMAGCAFIVMPPIQSSDWASWVQAVGSIGAIGGSFYLGSRQVQWQTREAHIDKQQKYLAIAKVAAGCLERIKETAGLAVDGSADLLYVLADTPLLDQTTSALAVVPLHEVGSAEVIVVWATFVEKSRLTFLIACSVTKEEAIRLEATAIGAKNGRARALGTAATSALKNFEILHNLIDAEGGKL